MYNKNIIKRNTIKSIPNKTKSNCCFMCPVTDNLSECKDCKIFFCSRCCLYDCLLCKKQIKYRKDYLAKVNIFTKYNFCIIL